MAVFSKIPIIRRRWSIGLSIVALGVIFAVGAILWHVVENSSLATVSKQIEQLKPFANTLRFLLIGTLALLWPRLISWVHLHKRINATEKSRLLAIRWRMIAWLLIIELMVGQNLLNRFIQLLSSVTP